MNPYFMATFGAIAAMGLVVFAISYYVFVRLRVGQATGDDKCGSCGIASEISRLIPCKDHSGVVKDIEGIKAWIKSHEEDYRRISKRLDDLADRGR